MRYLRQISPWTRAMLGVVALAIVAVGVTVGSASGSDSTTTDPAAGSGTAVPAPPDPDAIKAFQDCMAEHGVDVPKPGEPFAGPRGAHEPSAETRQAFEACGD